SLKPTGDLAHGVIVGMMVLAVFAWMLTNRQTQARAAQPQGSDMATNIDLERTVERHVAAGKNQENPPRFMCIDGRAEQAGYGVLGGSAGLVLRVTGAYLASVPGDIRGLAEERLLRSMAKFLTWFDTSVVRVEGHTADGYDHPRKPGCGYCGLLLQNPESMHLSSPVTMAVLRYIEPQDRLVTLHGQHEEVGVLVFTDEHAPAAIPLVDDEQVFVYHAQREAAFYDQHSAIVC